MGKRGNRMTKERRSGGWSAAGGLKSAQLRDRHVNISKYGFQVFRSRMGSSGTLSVYNSSSDVTVTTSGTTSLDARQLSRETRSSSAIYYDTSQSERILCEQEQDSLASIKYSSQLANGWDASPTMKEILSDYGLSLFAPLHGLASPFAESFSSKQEDRVDLAFRDCNASISSHQSRDDYSQLPQLIQTTSSVDSLDCFFSVDVVAEPMDVLQDCPRLISNEVMQYLTEFALPNVLKLRRWVRAYSLARDGDSFEMMLTLVAPHKYTLTVVRTTRGEVFGGFVDQSWDSSAGFYGGGQAFLFSCSIDENFKYPPNRLSPMLGSDRVAIYPWTGSNNYTQFCDVTRQMFAMGGGGTDGTFGLCVEDCFWKGSTGSCDTFKNAPLARQAQFEIVDFEVYGFGW